MVDKHEEEIDMFVIDLSAPKAMTGQAFIAYGWPGTITDKLRLCGFFKDWPR